MWGRNTRRIVIGLAAIGAMALGAGYAFGASETITTSPSCCSYSKSTFTIDAGQDATFHNETPGVPHSMTAASKGPDHKRLFNSGITSSGKQAAVNGTQYLAPGTYHFFCLVHGPSMSANLVVSGSGAPVARPEIEVKVLSRKIHAVVRSRRLKVRVSAVTESQNVELSAAKGLVKLGAPKSGINLAAGSSRTVKLNVSPGVNAGFIREGMAKAKVKVIGSVPFGSPATAHRNLS
jgi:plastocyanin